MECNGCHGVIRGTRSFTLDTAIKNHLMSCPSRHASVDQPTNTQEKKK